MLTSLIVIALSGCAIMPNEATMPRMTYTDLQYYRIDCSMRDQQKRFLESQKTNHSDKLVAGFARLSGDQDAYKIWDGSYNQEVEGLLQQQQEMCYSAR